MPSTRLSLLLSSLALLFGGLLDAAIAQEPSALDPIIEAGEGAFFNDTANPRTGDDDQLPGGR